MRKWTYLVAANAMAAAQVERAKGAVAEVTSYINETYLIASADGEVTEIYPSVKERDNCKCSGCSTLYNGRTE